MNLLININENLYSIKSSSDGAKKLQSAINEAIYDIKIQIEKNIERQKKGLKPQPYNTSVMDEYGKEVVSIKETKNLLEIKNEYNKKQNKLPFEKREKNLLSAMNEVGNSNKTEKVFREELANQLNSSLFVTNTNLTPGLEQILNYFGDTRGVFNTINFKEDISVKCIKDLIDMPNPKTGKPPKSFEHLLSNIISVNKIFTHNENREKYIDIARSYINISYKNLIPEQYREYFRTPYNFENFLNTLTKTEKNLKNDKLKDFNQNYQKKALDLLSKEDESIKLIMYTKKLTNNLSKEDKLNIFNNLTDEVKQEIIKKIKDNGNNNKNSNTNKSGTNKK